MKAKTTSESTTVQVKRLALSAASFDIRGTSIFCQNKFSKKAEEQIRATQEAGGQAKSKKNREPKDFEALYEAAKYRSTEGWNGIPCSAFRNAMISACRTVGYTMTRAKLALWIVADGFDRDDNTPLIRIYGEPKMDVRPARNDSGVIDLRSRPVWAPGWTATVRIQWDDGMLSLEDVTNLMHRVGLQVGVGEGRPDSKNSAGLGWGTFELI